MLPLSRLPRSWMVLLARFRGCFTAPTFDVFCMLVTGFVAQTGPRTVCGMLVGAGLSRVWPHDRAHRFFARARWSADQVGLALAEVVVAVLVPASAPILVVIDDSLFGRSGRKVFAAGWFHDGSVKAGRGSQVRFGNSWVIAGIVVWPPLMARPVCLPVACRLVRKGEKSRLRHARELIEMIAAWVPGRDIDVVADAAYTGRELRGLPDRVSVTARLRRNAALYQLPPAGTGGRGRGRPQLKGDKIGTPVELAAQLSFTPASVHRYGTSATVRIACCICLWYTGFHTRPVQLILIREAGTDTGFDAVLVSTDTTATPETIIQRYAARWSIEVAIQDAKQLTGVGEARNRAQAAVERTVPFGLITTSLAIVWYTRHGHHPADIAEHRDRAPWYTTKTHPSTADMITKLRRVIIAANNRGVNPKPPTPAEIHAIQLAWEAA